MFAKKYFHFLFAISFIVLSNLSCSGPEISEYQKLSHANQTNSNINSFANRSNEEILRTIGTPKPRITITPIPTSSPTPLPIPTLVYIPTQIPSPNPTPTITIEPTLTSSTNSLPSANLELNVLDVGQADSIFVRFPNGKNMLIDAGNGPDAPYIINELVKRKVTKIDTIIATHPHEDHIGGMAQVIKYFPVGNIYMPKATSNSITFANLAKTISNKQIPVIEPKANTFINLDSFVNIRIIAPNNIVYSNLNSYSIVLKMIYGKTSMLLTGDADHTSEAEMLAKNYDLKSDLLKVGHHGSKTSSTASFLAKVLPKYAIVSVALNSKFGHPTPETLQRLANINAQVFRTDYHAIVTAISDGKQIKITKEK